jgi:hypothetical protein
MTESDLTCPNCRAALPAGARFCRSCGVSVPAAAVLVDEQPPAPTGALPAPTPTITVPAYRRWLAAARVPLRRWWRSRRVRWVVAVVLVVTVGGGIGLVYTLSGLNPPDGPVRELFAALAAHDAPRAGRLGGCHTSALCSDGALRTGYQAPTHLVIGETTYGLPDPTTRRPDKRRASVRVRYQLGGVEHTDTVTLLRSGGGLVRHWSIADPPGEALDVLSSTVTTARLGGADVPAVAPDAVTWRRDGGIHAWPGVYTLAAKETALVAAVPTTVVVAGDSGVQRVTIDVAVRPTVTTEVDRQVRARIDTCATKTALRPDSGGGILPDCPFSATTSYVYTKDIRWTVVDYPKIEIRKADDGSIKVRTTTPGHARVDYQVSTDVIEPRRWTPTSTTTEIKVSGEVEATKDGTGVTWNG